MSNIYEYTNRLRKETGESIFISFRRVVIAMTSKVTMNYSEDRSYTIDKEDVDSLSKDQSEERYHKLLLFTERFRDIHDNDLSTHEKLLLLDRLCQVMHLRGAYYEDGHYHYKGNSYGTKEALIKFLFPKVNFNPSLLMKERSPLTLESLREEVDNFLYISNAHMACVLDNTALVAESKETYDNLTNFLNEFAFSGYIDTLTNSIVWKVTDNERFIHIRTETGKVRILKDLAEEGIYTILTEGMGPEEGKGTRTEVYPVAVIDKDTFAFTYQLN